MSTVKKRNPLMTIMVIVMVLVLAVLAVQIFWPQKVSADGTTFSRVGGGGKKKVE